MSLLITESADEQRQRRRKRAEGDVVQDGEYVSFSLAFRDDLGVRDHAPGRTIFINDEPAQIADSVLDSFGETAEGQGAVRLAMDSHQRAHAWREGAGLPVPAFTADQRRDALLNELQQQSDVAAAYDGMLASYQRDARPAVSIDEELRKAIAESAKAEGKSPEDWLAEQTDRDVQKLIESVVTQSVASVRAATIASALGLDAEPADPVAAAYDEMIRAYQRSAA